MRQNFHTMAAAGALFAAGVLCTAPTAAMTAGVLSDLRLATVEFETVQMASCFRYGWHGWGNYPNCDKPEKKKRQKPRRKE